MLRNVKNKSKHKTKHSIKYIITFSGSTTTPDRAGENITWYVLKCIRLEDGVTNTVHRLVQIQEKVDE